MAQSGLIRWDRILKPWMVTAGMYQKNCWKNLAWLEDVHSSVFISSLISNMVVFHSQHGSFHDFTDTTALSIVRQALAPWCDKETRPMALRYTFITSETQYIHIKPQSQTANTMQFSWRVAKVERALVQTRHSHALTPWFMPIRSHITL